MYQFYNVIVFLYHVKKNTHRNPLYGTTVIDPWTQNIYGFSVLSFTVFPLELLKKHNHHHKNATCTLKVFYYDAQAIKYTEKIFPL